MTLATISVVSHGHGPMLLRLLADLARQDIIRQCRLVVILNIPETGIEEHLPPAVACHVVVNERPRGFGANHNCAFHYCDSPWFLVLNPDLRLHEETVLRRLLEIGGATPGVGLLAPRVVGSSGEDEDSVRSNLSPLALWKRARHGAERLRPVGAIRKPDQFIWLAGMFLAVRATAYRQVRGFDERYFLYCEDYDLCARLYLSGHALLHCGEVAVIHDAQRDSHRSSRHLRWHIASLFKVWTSNAFWRVTLGRSASKTASRPDR